MQTLNPGDRIRLTKMADDPDPVPEGATGTVEATPVRVNGWYQVEVAWDNGRRLMMTVPPDEFEVI